MKSTLSKIAFLSALSSVACTTNSPDEPAPSHSKPQATVTPTAGGELALLDRKQASYLTTSVRSSSGVRFLDGHARLQIVATDTGPHITLDVTGEGADSRPWRAAFQLEESQLLGKDALLDRSPDSLPAAKHGIVGLLSGERASRARLAIAREAQPHMRSAFHGHVQFDDGSSAEFRTEYDLSCVVPPEMLGQAVTVQQDPDSHAQFLSEDRRFETAFCQKYAALR